uniref:hypothetical protein n=1 Tax=Alistipes onderdonkii TaxID=328813 RepID=UPI0040276684
MRPDVRDFMRMGTSFLLAMCKNSHAARILEINSTNVRFFITNTLSGEHARISFSPFTTLDAPDGRLCRLSVGCATACRGSPSPQEKTSLLSGLTVFEIPFCKSERYFY